MYARPDRHLWCPLPVAAQFLTVYQGRVTSFYANNLQKYTSFRAHPPSEGAVHQLLFNEKGVLALGARGVHMALRRGPPVWPHIR